MITYPTWRYHATLPPMLIHSKEEEPGAGWADSPPAAAGQDNPADVLPPRSAAPDPVAPTKRKK